MTAVGMSIGRVEEVVEGPVDEKTQPKSETRSESNLRLEWCWP
jgi:hypothetical protein